MATNLTIQSPNFDKIRLESGYFTRDAVMTLWEGLNDTRSTELADVTGLRAELAPKSLSLAPSGTTNNLDIRGYSILSLTGSVNESITGFWAPDTNVAKLLFVQNSGTATYTLSNLSASSESQNQIASKAGTDISLASGGAVGFVYLASKWRQIF